MRHSRSLGKVRPAERRRRLRRLHVEGKKYEHGVDSRRKERVPRGEVATYVWKNSRGRKSTTVYDGEIRGDTIVGWVELDFSGDFVDVAWKASRVVEAER